MPNIKFGHHKLLVLFSICMILITHCVPQPPEDPDEIATPVPTTIQVTPEPPKITLYQTDDVPDAVFGMDAPNHLTRIDDPAADLWLGLTSQAPDGELLKEITWFYALVAPFPTVVDNVGFDGIQQLWQGDLPLANANAQVLYLPETFFKVMESWWGYPAGEGIRTYQDPPSPEYLWDGPNTWAILPFESLEPRFKVITIDNDAPILSTFSDEAYPLKVNLSLINRNPERLRNSEIQDIVEMVEQTNTNPDKKTILLMTGVTALVRATAYQMEMKGVMFPAEDIIDWFSEADLVHISNEVAFYENCPFPEPDQEDLFFCSHPDYIELLDQIGTDIIELTGNHQNDVLKVYGEDALSSTLDLYEQYGMVYYGGGQNLAEAKSSEKIVHNGNKLAFVGCNAYGPDFAWATEERGGSAPCEDYQWMADEVSRLADEGYLPIATFQYFEDYVYYPTAEMVRDFTRMAEAGAIIVNGSQAHTPKTKSFEDQAFIDYGLGNLFFDQMGLIVNDELIVQTVWVFIQRHTFYNGRHVSIELLTALLEDFAKPRPMTELERAYVLQEIFNASGW